MIATRSLTVRIATALAFSVLLLAPARAATEVERIVSPLGIDQENCFVDAGREIWLSLDAAQRGRHGD